MDLIIIKTRNKYYVCKLSDRGLNLDNLYFDGKHPEISFLKNWFLINSIPETIEKEVSQPSINRRYELKNKTITSNKIPLKFTEDEVIVNGHWRDEIADLSSLYELKSDSQPNIKQEIPFEIKKVIEVTEIIEHDEFKYKICPDKDNNATEVKNTGVIHQLIDSLIFPDILLQDKECKLSSNNTYKIIRQHIKKHIDPRYAEITSDYDFCFTVKKRIQLAEPIKYSVDVNNSLFQKRKRIPKYETRYRSDRLVEIFEMTFSPRCYQGYTVINGFRGKNHTDLRQKIDNYLESLMEYINKPIVDCEYCCGKGVIVDSNFMGEAN